ncbi:MAG: hypothetical protein IJ071_01925 [Ruminococcus sp.]|nr:hypothetical protein [Ruminococcus sp.]
MAAFYNQATISVNGNVTSSNIVAGEITQVLSADKNSVIGTYSPESDTVFTVSMVNSGDTDLTGVTVTDDLGEYTISEEGAQAVPLTYSEGSAALYVNGVLQPAPTVSSAQPLTVSGITIPAGGNAMLVYAATVNQYAPLGAGESVTNTAQITGNGIASPVLASAVITPSSAPDLAISKSLTPSTVPENGRLTYTFIIQNYGNTEASAQDSVIFRDAFSPALDNIEVTFNGAPWTAANYTYSSATGIFQSLPGQVTVPAAEYTQDPDTGVWSTQPGVSTLVISGNIISSAAAERCAQTARR